MSKRVVVVGGGIIGLCCAYALAREGYRVTVVDRGEAADANCSHGNAGLIVPSHIVPMAAPGVVAAGLKWMRDPESPFYVKPRLSPELAGWGWKFFRAGTQAHVERSGPLLRDLNLASRAAFEELDDDLRELGGFGLEKRGLLMLFQSQHGMDEEAKVAQRARALGMKAEILDARGAAEKEPSLRLQVLGAAFYADDCHLSPGKLMLALQERLAGCGVELRWQTEISRWKSSGGRITGATTRAGEEIEADEWVLCGGSWSGEASRGLNLKLPMQAGKGYSISVPRPRHLPTLPSLLMEARVAVTPMGHSLRVAGTMEMAGLNTDVNPRRVAGILRAVPEYYPDFEAADFDGVQAWAGLRPCSPDGLPFVGRTSKYENLCVATGHAMMGLSLGPITGRLIAQSIAGRESQISTELLSPDRYA